MYDAPAMSEPKKSNTGKIVGAVLAVLVLSCCCVSGVGGVVGYNSFQTYTMQSRLSEPRFELGSIARSEESYCQMNGSFAATAGPQPLTHGGAERVSGDFANDPGFRAIGYDAYMPVYCSYAIVPTSAIGHIDIRATCDADGDGLSSTHTISCVPGGCDCPEMPTSTGDADEALPAY